MSAPEKTFWTIARQQFARNRSAVVGFWCVVAIFAIAILAPVLAQSSPFRLQVGDQQPTYPWFGDLFDQNIFPSEVDLFFNLLLVFAPVVLPLLVLLKRRRALVAKISTGVFLWVLYAIVGSPAVVESSLGRAVFFPQHLLRYSRPKQSYFEVRAPQLLPVLTRQRVSRFEASVKEAQSMLATEESRLAKAGADETQRNNFLVMRDAAKAELEKAELQLRLWQGRQAEAEKIAKDPARRVRALVPPVGYHHDDNDAERITEAPTFTGWGVGHFLGTDTNGRDVLARILYGTRVSMTIGVLAVAIYCTIGTILGSLMGYFGGWVDMVGGRFVEVMICFPTLPFILILVAVTKSKNIFMIMVAIGLVSWTGVARLIRGQFLTERGLDYVVAARALGIPNPRIVFRHVLPNAIHPMFVSATFGVASAILLESSLAFLGLGDPLVPSWGQLMLQGRNTGRFWLILSPGAAIFITVVVLNLVGEGLRDALDPKLRQ